MADSIMVRIPKELAERVDDARDARTSREAFVRRAVEAALDGTSLTRAAATSSRVSVTNLERQAKLNKDKDKRN